MKRLFFPHTAMGPGLAAALHTALGPTTLLHPLPEAVADRTAELAEARQVELLFPLRGDGDALTTAMASFRLWAAEHAGNDLPGLVGRGGPIPFFDAEATSRITAEIKSGRGAATEAARGERMRRARLLLILAEEFESRHSELADDMSAFELKERRMLEELKGEDEASAITVGPSSAGAAAPVVHMLSARVTAWAQLALAAADWWSADPSVLFLTDCREVLDHVTERTTPETVLERYPVASASAGLRAWLADPQGPPPAEETSAATATIGLTLVRLSGQDTFGWLRGLAGARPGATTDPDCDPSAHAVYVGLVEQG